MARAARLLKGHLDWIVEQLDTLEARGYPPDGAWPALQMMERRFPSGFVRRHGALVAIEAYAEHSTNPRWAFFRAMQLARLALAAVRGSMTIDAAMRGAEEARGDEALRDESENLRAAVAKGPGRTEPSRWQAAYNILAWNADVVPRPDHTRGQRGDLRKLYETVVHERALVERQKRS